MDIPVATIFKLLLKTLTTSVSDSRAVNWRLLVVCMFVLQRIQPG